MIEGPPAKGTRGRGLEKYVRWVVGHRRLVLIAIGAVTVLLATAAARLHVEIDSDRQLPQDHPYIAALNDLYRLFGDKNLVVIGLFPHDGEVFSPAFLQKLTRITDRVTKLPGANPALVQSLAAPHVKDIRGSEDGVDVTALMEEPPTDAEGARAVRERLFANDLYVGTLVSRDGRAAAIQASFDLTPKTAGYRELQAAVEGALAAEADGSFDYRLSGPVIFMSQLSAYSARMAYFFPIALLVIGLIHYDAFRTVQALVLPLVTALLSVLWALGLMGLVGVPLDPLNTTTPILILAVAAGHAVQVLKRFYEEYEHTPDVQEAVVACLLRVGPVMLSAGTVAALSFCSLATFGTATIRTFGLFTGFGILSAMVAEMTLIPAVRAMLPAPRTRERTREAAAHPILDAFLDTATRLATRHGPAVMWSSLALVVVCALLASRLEIDTSIKREFRSTDRVRQDDAVINASFAGTETLIFLVEGESEGSLEEPTVLRAIDRLERAMEREPGVGKVTSYVDFVGRLHKAMTADRSDAGILPATRPLAAQYLFLYSMSGGGQSLDTMLDPTHRFAKIRMLIHDDRSRYGLELIAKAQDLIAKTFPEGYRVRYTGTLASRAAATEVMVEGKLRNIVQIACITVLISALLLRSVLAGLLVAVPLALAVAVNFGMMGLLGIPLDTVTAALSAMAVGIGADYAMYLLFRIREEWARVGDVELAIRRALMTSGKAILFVSSAIAAGYATLCLSGFGIHVQLGSLVALAMVVSATSALVLLPAIVVALAPRLLPAVTPEVTADAGKAALPLVYEPSERAPL